MGIFTQNQFLIKSILDIGITLKKLREIHEIFNKCFYWHFLYFTQFSKYFKPF